MKDSSRSLWQQTFVSWLRIFFFCVVALGIFLVLPADTPKRIARFWRDAKRTFAERNQPFMDFLTNRDMEKAFGQYEQFKRPGSASKAPPTDK